MNSLMSKVNSVKAVENSRIAMTTKEIADRTGKRHDHVKRDCKKMILELGLGLPNFGGTYTSSQNKTLDCYVLNEELSITLVSGYDVKMRNAIIKRWKEMEQAGQEFFNAIQETDPAVLRKMADLSERASLYEDRSKVIGIHLEAAKEEIQELKPMAEYGESVKNSKNVYTATNVGALLGMTANALNKLLLQRKVLKKGSGAADYCLCAKFLNKGLTTYSIHTITHRNGEVETRYYLRWTRKGHDWLLEQLGKGVA